MTGCCNTAFVHGNLFEEDIVGDDWILNTGFWEDLGSWIDSDSWVD